MKHAEVLLNREDLDVKADAFLQFLVRDVAGRDAFRLSDASPPMKVSNLKGLVAAVQAMLNLADSGDYKTHHPATIRKMLNRIDNFSVRFHGLISNSGDTINPLPETFKDRTAYVIDLSQSDVEAQDLVFAAVISDLRSRMEQGRLGVKRLIVVVDELNKYAPTSGHETYVVRALRDIAARGRYLGLVLFGAQQFRSRVDPQVVGNSANSAYGHIQLEELANSIYTVYPQAVREKLATADPGLMMIRHPHFSQPVFVRFPLPSILRGNDGMSQYPCSPSLPIEMRILKQAVALGGGKVSEAQVREQLALLDPNEREESLNKICRDLAASQNGDPLSIINKTGRRVPAQKMRAPPIYSSDDPFAD
ncbi:MAG: hypothetical protein H0W86_01770 [Armatimonadetes bacterium]|nr:hypothetical protein [Armatimonadota bacterium]